MDYKYGTDPYAHVFRTGCAQHHSNKTTRATVEQRVRKWFANCLPSSGYNKKQNKHVDVDKHLDCLEVHVYKDKSKHTGSDCDDN